MQHPTSMNGTRDYARDYDLTSPDLAAGFDEVIADLNSRCRLARSEVGEGYWVALRQEDIKPANEDWETFSSATGFVPDRADGSPWLWPVEADPPVHTHVRKPLNKFFTSKAVQSYKEAVRQHARDLLAEFNTDDAVDVVANYANALPGRAFCVTVAGMGANDINYLHDKLQLGTMGPQDGRAAAMQDAFDRLEDYLRRRESEPPRGDIVDAILELEFEGCDWGRKVSVLTTYTMAGVGTTGYVIAAALRWLADNPTERRRLVDDPSLMPAAVEEFLRFFGSSPHVGRRATRPVNFAGVDLAPGDYVVMHYSAASRDPEVFDNPNELDISRPLPNRHISFGHGVHRCPGAHFARLQINEALTAFLQRFPEFEIQEDFSPAFQLSNTIVMETLPLMLSEV